MRCPKCRRTLESGTKICLNCRKPIVAAASDNSSDVLKPRSKVSLKGVGSRMSGTYRVHATRHKITHSDEFDSSKIRCMKCGTVNDKGTRICRKCRTRLT